MCVYGQKATGGWQQGRLWDTRFIMSGAITFLFVMSRSIPLLYFILLASSLTPTVLRVLLISPSSLLMI